MNNYEEIRQDLQMNKAFLRRLYEGNSAQNIATIEEASIPELMILIKCLHLLSSRQVPLSQQKYEEMSKSSKAKKLSKLHKHFQGHVEVEAMLRNPLESKPVLLKFKSYYPFLLYKFFNKI